MSLPKEKTDTSLTLKAILKGGYSNAQAQGRLSNYHKDAPENTVSYRRFDGEKDKGGNIVSVVRTLMKKGE